MKRILSSAILILTVANTFAQTKKKIEDTSKVPSGYIIGSIAIENRKKIVTNRWFYYSSKEIEQKIKYQEWKRGRATIVKREYCISLLNYGYEYKVGKTRVYFFRIKKPAGDYKFYEIELFLNTGYMQSTWEMKIDVPFKIEENKTKYIGELNLNEKGQILNVIDKFKEDSARFVNRYPKLDLSNTH